MTFNVGDIIRTRGKSNGMYYFGVVLATDFYNDDIGCDTVKVQWFALNKTAYMPVTHIVKAEGN